MRLNQFIAKETGLSRRTADQAITDGRVHINEHVAHLGAQVGQDDIVTFNGKILTPSTEIRTIILNKPVGYVCSRNGQGNKTIYELLPNALHDLKPVGRLDKDSSGLLLLTNDGQLAQELTHPSFTKNKIYEIRLDKYLNKKDQKQVEQGVLLDDGLSRLQLKVLANDCNWQITMHEGRNRQIRRTFEKLGYTVKRLHRTHFGPYKLPGITSGKFDKINL